MEMGDIPTVELHRHFEAGMSPETISVLAQRNDVTHVLTRNSKEPIVELIFKIPIQYEHIIMGFHPDLKTRMDFLNFWIHWDFPWE